MKSNAKIPTKLPKAFNDGTEVKAGSGWPANCLSIARKGFKIHGQFAPFAHFLCSLRSLHSLRVAALRSLTNIFLSVASPLRVSVAE